MNFNPNNWKYFYLNNLFNIKAGIYHSKNEFNEGDTPYCSSTNENNGVMSFIDLKPDFTGNKIITGKIGCTAYYQKNDFCATSDVNVLIPKFKMTEEVALFLITIINKSQNIRWNYGRQCRVQNMEKMKIKLPYIKNKNVIIPDWDFMINYIKKLRTNTIKTNIKSINNLSISNHLLKKYLLKDFFDITNGSSIDKKDTTDIEPKFNYVTRINKNNGVASKIDKIYNKKVFKSGSITVALGGSLGSSFLQDRDFYTGQNVAVLTPKIKMSKLTKLFFTVLIKKECDLKYSTFSRELNAHINKDFTIKLPIKNDKSIDWEFIEKFMNSFPYSDVIPS